MTELYLMRHGQTAANHRGIYCGQTDIALTAAGVQQAGNAAKHLPCVAHVYSSDLIRAKQTARIAMPHAKITYQNALREIDFGDFEGLNADQIQAAMPIAWHRYMEDFMAFTFPHGDAVQEYLTNAIDTIQSIVAAHENERLLVVSHKGFILVVLSHYLNGDSAHMFDYDIAPGSFIKLCIDMQHNNIKYGEICI